MRFNHDDGVTESSEGVDLTALIPAYLVAANVYTALFLKGWLRWRIGKFIRENEGGTIELERMFPSVSGLVWSTIWFSLGAFTSYIIEKAETLFLKTNNSTIRKRFKEYLSAAWVLIGGFSNLMNLYYLTADFIFETSNKQDEREPSEWFKKLTERLENRYIKKLAGLLSRIKKAISERAKKVTEKLPKPLRESPVKTMMLIISALYFTFRLVEGLIETYAPGDYDVKILGLYTGLQLIILEVILGYEPLRARVKEVSKKGIVWKLTEKETTKRSGKMFKILKPILKFGQRIFDIITLILAVYYISMFLGVKPPDLPTPLNLLRDKENVANMIPVLSLAGFILDGLTDGSYSPYDIAQSFYLGVSIIPALIHFRIIK